MSIENINIPSLEEIKEFAKKSKDKYNVALQKTATKYGFKNYQSLKKFKEKEDIKNYTPEKHIILNNNYSVDLFKIYNKNLQLIGTSGTGKTIILKNIITNYCKTNSNILVIDSFNDYSNLGTALNKEKLRVNTSKPQIPNPFVFPISEIGLLKYQDNKKTIRFANILTEILNLFEIKEVNTKHLLINQMNKELSIKNDCFIIKISEIIKENNLQIKSNHQLIEAFDTPLELENFIDIYEVNMGFFSNSYVIETIFVCLLSLYLDKIKKEKKKNLLIIDEFWRLNNNKTLINIFKQIEKESISKENATIVTSQKLSDTKSLECDNIIITDYSNYYNFTEQRDIEKESNLYNKIDDFVLFEKEPNYKKKYKISYSK